MFGRRFEGLANFMAGIRTIFHIWDVEPAYVGIEVDTTIHTLVCMFSVYFSLHLKQTQLEVKMKPLTTFLLVLLLTSMGCDTSGQLPTDKFATGDDVTDLTIDGLVIEFPKSLKQAPMTLNDDTLILPFEGFTFELRDLQQTQYKIFVDGEGLGSVSTSDRILIGFDGGVAVNGRVLQSKAK